LIRRLHRELNHPGKGEPERNGEARAQVALAVSTGDAVDREHHDVDAHGLGALQHRAIEAAVLVEVILVDLRRGVLLADLLEAHGAERRHAEHRPEFRRGRGDGPLAVVMEQTLKRRRRAIEWHGEPLTHHRHRQIDGLHSPQDVRYEIALLEACRVSPIGDFVVGRTVDVVEDRARKPALGQSPKVVKVVAIAYAHRALADGP